ncbi:hypothetical protein D3C87_1718970 [compost metagenome]
MVHIVIQRHFAGFDLCVVPVILRFIVLFIALKAFDTVRKFFFRQHHKLTFFVDADFFGDLRFFFAQDSFRSGLNHFPFAV